jgi:hypothetical protein
VRVGARAPVPQLDDGSADARASVTVDDRDDELRRPPAQRRPRQLAAEAVRRPEGVRLRLVLAAARRDQPGQEEKQDP